MLYISCLWVKLISDLRRFLSTFFFVLWQFLFVQRRSRSAGPVLVGAFKVNMKRWPISRKGLETGLDVSHVDRLEVLLQWVTQVSYCSSISKYLKISKATGTKQTAPQSISNPRGFTSNDWAPRLIWWRAWDHLVECRTQKTKGTFTCRHLYIHIAYMSQTKSCFGVVAFLGFLSSPGYAWHHGEFVWITYEILWVVSF